jgi:molybdenum cofactor synthesis domain-containing protein
MSEARKAAVITCSNRSYSGERGDDSGAIIDELLREAGFAIAYRTIVPDEVDRIQAAVHEALEAEARVILTTGGTGPTPSDVTPEAVSPLLEREIPGIAEAMRLVSREKVPTSILSRGVAGIIGSALVVTLPGSPGGARDGMAVLSPILGHIVDQIAGGDHKVGGGV